MQDIKKLFKDVQSNIKHLKKSTEKKDLASKMSGGSIDSTYDTKLIFPNNVWYNVFVTLGIIPKFSKNPARYLIDPSMAPGNCFAFKGDKGVVSIQLSRKAQLESVTIEHIEQEITGTISNAPKEFSISVSVLGLILICIFNKTFYNFRVKNTLWIQSHYSWATLALIRPKAWHGRLSSLKSQKTAISTSKWNFCQTTEQMRRVLIAFKFME